MELDLSEMIDVKGWKSIGKRVSPYPVVKVVQKSGDANKAVLAQEGEKRLGMQIVRLLQENLPIIWRAKMKKEVPERSAEKKRTSADAAAKEAKLLEKAQETGSEDNQDKSKGADQETADGTSTFHIGDTIEFKIPPRKDNGHDDQLGLFDHDK